MNFTHTYVYFLLDVIPLKIRRFHIKEPLLVPGGVLCIAAAAIVVIYQEDHVAVAGELEGGGLVHLAGAGHAVGQYDWDDSLVLYLIAKVNILLRLEIECGRADP